MSSDRNHHGRVLWLNGRFLPVEQAGISPFDRGFLYGDGLFETLRADQGQLLYWKDHLERIRESAACLRIECDWNADWRGIFAELLLRNALQKDVASAKVVLTRGVVHGMGLPDAAQATVCLTVQPYQAPDDSTYATGWKLHIFREGFSPPLARYKTLNYLYHLLARQRAVDAGCDEAIILDDRGKVAETAAGSLLVKEDGRWARPASPYQLVGTTVSRVSHLLAQRGHSVSSRDMDPEDLASAETVWVCNSLMGIMPVGEVDGRPLRSPSGDLAACLREAFFERGSLLI
jgi:branched-chain amino acid aminotransferase